MELQPAQEVARGGGASSSGARELVGGAQSTQMVSSGCGGLCPSPRLSSLPTYAGHQASRGLCFQTSQPSLPVEAACGPAGEPQGYLGFTSGVWVPIPRPHHLITLQVPLHYATVPMPMHPPAPALPPRPPPRPSCSAYGRPTVPYRAWLKT